MPSIPLPENASLEHLKNQAKLVQGLVEAGDDGALGMVQEFHPRLSGAPEGGKFRRSDAQLVIARLYGFSNWTSLRDHLDVVGEFGRTQPADREPVDRADRFVSLACVSYSRPDSQDRIQVANQTLESDPSLAGASVAAIATTGHHELLAEHVGQQPGLVNDLCGPNRWPPLLYCAYSRVESSDAALSTLAAARFLLENGADPNAGFLWRGLIPPFTALTGVFGWGEADQPPHADSLTFARLLLEAGADPNDGQTLYNNGFAGTAHDNPAHLELLVEFGLGVDQAGPWYRRFGSQLRAPEKLLHDELDVATVRGLPNRLRFLTSLGLDVQDHHRPTENQ